MINTERRIKFLAAGLSALAGFVDVTGFLNLGGFFVSFMSGNTTRLAVGMVYNPRAAIIAACLIILFVLGVVLGSLIGHAAGKHRAPVIIGYVAFLLATAAALGMAKFPNTAAIVMTLAMGAQNAVFTRDGEMRIGLAYMTETLVKMGQRLAGVYLGENPLAWWPYFLLWLGLAAGALAGALLYPHLGLNNLWVAAIAAGGFALLSLRT